ncbi:MAG: hypothetical protein SOT05_10325, partial [Anaerovoracaceae bacterium]|nr:hypothetical protein [Anaerovoracaceae bacterium]
MTTGTVIKFPFLYKNMLRFNIPVTVIITAVTSSAMEMSYLSFSPLCDNAPALLFIYLLSVAVTIMLVRFDRLIDMLILDCFYQFIYNTLGAAIMSVFIAVYGLITDADMNTWFSQSTSTVADYIIRYIAVTVCFIIGLVICRKCTPLIVNMSMKLKLPLFMGTALPIFIFMVMKHIANPDASQMLSGFLVICYGILLTLIAISLLIFFINVFLNTREENQLMQAKIEAQNEYYHRVLKIQQDLREAKHDLVNRLVAYNMSQSTGADSDR